MNYTNYLINVKGFTPSTANTYMRYVNLLKESNNDYNKALAKLSNASNNTKRLALSAMKSYYKYIKDKRHLEIELPKREIKCLEWVTYEEYKQLLERYTTRTKTSFTTRMVIRLLFETGIRSSELLSIKKSDIVNNRIKIYGKGKKERYIYISEWLRNELVEFSKSITNDEIFQFTYKNLHKKVTKILPSRRLTPHMFRRGYAKHLDKMGISIYEISISMGHNDINTTASYIKKTSENLNLSNMF